MSVDFKGENAKNKIVVKNIIIAKKTTNVKTTAKSLKIKITLKGKKVYKAKKIVVKFRGKSYSIKTNSKGIAYFKVTSKVINKLKKGTRYTYSIKYNNDLLRRYIKAK